MNEGHTQTQLKCEFINSKMVMKREEKGYQIAVIVRFSLVATRTNINASHFLTT